jgi:DNA-binding LacI/PurR family transcriptional regulator
MGRIMRLNAALFVPLLTNILCFCIMQPVAGNEKENVKMGDKTVKTIADIAELAGVSKSTVSRALNDSPLIGDETKTRIRKIAEEHLFQINNTARCLSMQQSRTIAFVSHAYHYKECCYSLSDLFILEIIGAISTTLMSSDYDLLMAHVDPFDTGWPHRYLDSGKADGLILMTSTRKQFHIKSLLEMKAPFIIWGYPLEGYNYCSVVGDNYSGGEIAAKHLIRSGRKKIAFIGGPAVEVEVQKRYQGYEKALNDAGMAIDPALVTYGEFSGDSGADRMKQLLEQAPDLDAVFACSDLMAASAINVLKESGRTVPGDVAVIGYDNLSIGNYSSPRLTTVSQNIPVVGKLLAKNLLEYLQSGVVSNVIIPAELVVRESA